MKPDLKTDISTDIEALSRQINLPLRPTEAIWLQETLGKRETRVPGPTDYRLTAVMKFDSADIPKVIEKLSATPAEAPVGNVELESWFPQEIQGLAQKRGSDSVVEGARYSPDLFLRSPYSGGKLIRVGQTNYFVLKILSF